MVPGPVTPCGGTVKGVRFHAGQGRCRSRTIVCLLLGEVLVDAGAKETPAEVHVRARRQIRAFVDHVVLGTTEQSEPRCKPKSPKATDLQSEVCDHGDESRDDGNEGAEDAEERVEPDEGEALLRVLHGP